MTRNEGLTTSTLAALQEVQGRRYLSPLTFISSFAALGLLGGRGELVWAGLARWAGLRGNCVSPRTRGDKSA